MLKIYFSLFIFINLFLFIFFCVSALGAQPVLSMMSKAFSNYVFIFSLYTIHRYPIFSTRYSVICKAYTGYHGTSEIEHGLCACTVHNLRAKARG